jgi:hypothetical protein
MYQDSLYPNPPPTRGNYSRGGSRGGHPPKIGKNMIVWGKIMIFHTKYPKNFRASFRNWKKYDFLA